MKPVVSAKFINKQFSLNLKCKTHFEQNCLNSTHNDKLAWHLLIGVNKLLVSP